MPVLPIIDDFSNVKYNDTPTQSQPKQKAVKNRYVDTYVPKDAPNRSPDYSVEELQSKIDDPEKVVEDLSKVHPDIPKKEIGKLAFVSFLAESMKRVNSAKNMDDLMYAREVHNKYLKGFRTNKFLNSNSKASRDFFKLQERNFENSYAAQKRKLISEVYDKKIDAENKLDVTPEDYSKYLTQIYGKNTIEYQNS